MKADGKVVKCEECGEWHFSNKTCKNCGGGDDLTHKSAIEENSNTSNLTCIICGAESNGQHFCKSFCYKYKDKVLYLQIKK